MHPSKHCETKINWGKIWPEEKSYIARAFHPFFLVIFAHFDYLKFRTSLRSPNPAALQNNPRAQAPPSGGCEDAFDQCWEM